MAVVTSEFLALARVVAKSKGMPDLPMIVVPHPFESLSHAQARQLAADKFAEIVRLLAESAS